jgi:hypothetical protein
MHLCRALLLFGDLRRASAILEAAFNVDGQIPLLAGEKLHGQASRPNIVLILTDDQDLHLDSLAYSPHVKSHLIDRGTSFQRHFCTTALCCPSRVTLFTGKLAHNTNVTNVVPPYGAKLPGCAVNNNLELTGISHRRLSKVPRPRAER